MTHDLIRLGHPAGAAPFTCCERSLRGIEHAVTDGARLLDIASRLHVRPHAIVHGGNEENLRFRGEETRGEKIVGESMGSAADEVSSRRSNDDNVRGAGKTNVIQRVTRAEYLRVYRTSSDGLERNGTDELAGAASHHHVYLRPSLCKQTRQPH